MEGFSKVQRKVKGRQLSPLQGSDALPLGEPGRCFVA